MKATPEEIAAILEAQTSNAEALGFNAFTEQNRRSDTVQLIKCCLSVQGHPLIDHIGGLAVLFYADGNLEASLLAAFQSGIDLAEAIHDARQLQEAIER